METASGTAEPAQNLRIAGPAAPEGNDRLRFRIRHSAAGQLEQRRPAQAGILEPCKRRPGKDRLALCAVLGHFQDDIVGKPGEVHGFILASRRPELIQGGEFKNRPIVHARLNQPSDRGSCIERLSTAMKNADDLNAIAVRQSCVVHLQNVRNFRAGDVQRLQLLDGVVGHARIIEQLRIAPAGMSAAGQEDGDGKNSGSTRAVVRRSRAPAKVWKFSHIIIVVAEQAA